MSRSSSEIVSEIKTLYGRRREEKLQIQRDMVALRDEHGWTEPQIARATEIPQSTVSNWLIAYDEATKLGRPSRLTPESVQAASDQRVAARVLASAPIEQVENLLVGLPTSRQAAIAAATGHSYEKAREEVREQNAARAASEPEGRGGMPGRAREIAGGFASLGIVEHLEQATEELNELAADASLSDSYLRKIEHAYEELGTALSFARSLIGERS